MEDDHQKLPLGDYLFALQGGVWWPPRTTLLNSPEWLTAIESKPRDQWTLIEWKLWATHLELEGGKLATELTEFRKREIKSRKRPPGRPRSRFKYLFELARRDDPAPAKRRGRPIQTYYGWTAAEILDAVQHIKRSNKSAAYRTEAEILRWAVSVLKEKAGREAPISFTSLQRAIRKVKAETNRR